MRWDRIIVAGTELFRLGPNYMGWAQLPAWAQFRPSAPPARNAASGNAPSLSSRAPSLGASALWGLPPRALASLSDNRSLFSDRGGRRPLFYLTRCRGPPQIPPFSGFRRLKTPWCKCLYFCDRGRIILRFQSSLNQKIDRQNMG